MRTLDQLITIHGVDVDDHLDRQATVAIIAGLQRQGDVIVIPAAIAGQITPATTPVPASGVPVVRGEAGGNTHLLLADGPVFYNPAPASVESLDLGVVTVPDGSTGYLAHPEHAYSGIAPGTYLIRRQREQADEIRMVAD